MREAPFCFWHSPETAEEAAEAVEMRAAAGQEPGCQGS